jgi:hypothetical protein
MPGEMLEKERLILNNCLVQFQKCKALPKKSLSMNLKIQLNVLKISNNKISL